MKKFYPIIILTAIMLSSVILLSLTNAFTKDKILAQQNEQTLSELKSVFPEMTDYTLNKDIYIINANGQKIGYGFIATGKGYGGAISILVGLENKTTVKGIRIITQSETAGLGARIALPSFADKFNDKNIADIKLKQDGGQIDGITGSTISSRAVVEAVRNTALAKVQELPN